jgi:hypothetical protein
MNENEKKYIRDLVSNNDVGKVFRFAKNKGYDMDTVFGIVTQEVFDLYLNAQLDLDCMSREPLRTL